MPHPMTKHEIHVQAKADERVAALEKENVVLRVQAADSKKRAEELQQHLSACQVLNCNHCILLLILYQDRQFAEVEGCRT